MITSCWAVALLLCGLLPVLFAQTSVVVHLNQTSPISPLVYGTNFATSQLLSWGAGTGVANRNGGNLQSVWNWQLDASNSGLDWFFLTNTFSDAYPDGSSNDLQMDATLGTAGTFITTVSTIGYVYNTRDKHWSFPVHTYGAQQSTECTATGNADYCQPDAGNGVLLNGTTLHGNTTYYKRSYPADAVAFVAHMRARASPAAFDAHTILALDNEPSGWHQTHADVHGEPQTYAELWNYTVSYGAALKAAYPNVKIAGPIWDSWCSYFWSARDGCGGGARADIGAHNNTFITPWLLQQVNAYYLQHGVQLLDIIDIHYYPNVPDDESTQANQAQFTDQVRSLYDPTYADPGWIGVSGCNTACQGPYVNLINLFQGWIKAYAPNLTIALAVSEYSFDLNSDATYSPTLANAETLAVFASRGVAYANRWSAPAANSIAELAFRLYLNYDGALSKVMGVSAATTSTLAPLTTAYAVYNATLHQLYVLVFHKGFTANTAVGVTVTAAGLMTGGSAVSAAVWQMSAASQAITAVSAASFAFSSASSQLTLSGYSVPARSATLFVLSGVGQSSGAAVSRSSSSSSTASQALSPSSTASQPSSASTSFSSSSAVAADASPSSSASIPSSSTASSQSTLSSGAHSLSSSIGSASSSPSPLFSSSTGRALLSSSLPSMESAGTPSSSGSASDSGSPTGSPISAMSGASSSTGDDGRLHDSAASRVSTTSLMGWALAATLMLMAM